ncbi:VOC family protein [Gammaproteobacteria bacterium]|nr:VOC family protein [Gammaproteobacteria bacterium]
MSVSDSLKLLGGVALALCLAACAATTYNLPPVSQDTDGQRHPGKFVWHDLISDDVAGSQRFYSELFSWEFRSLPLIGAQYWIISLDGEFIGGMVSQKPLAARRDISQWVSVMSTQDVQLSTDAVKSSGGKILREPVSLGDRGRIAVYEDPQGAVFAALETPSGDPIDSGNLPSVGAFLWHELWTTDPSAATDFYAALSGLQAGELDATNIDSLAITYYVLRADDEPRAGVRSSPAAEAPPVWMPYLRLLSLEQMEEILARVPALGGEVLVAALARPSGGHMALIAGPSGAPIALQTWPEDRAMPSKGNNAGAQ